jgi:purine-cytosine permease-like protein
MAISSRRIKYTLRRTRAREMASSSILAADPNLSAADKEQLETSSNGELSALELQHIADDFMQAPVPLNRRYNTLTMTLLWITMLANFPMVIIGFEFYRTGFSLGQVVTGTIIGSLILVAFQFFSGLIGARTGLNYSLLMKPVFGKLGVQFVCVIWSLMFLAWYALNAVLMTDGIKGLFGLSFWTPFLAVPLVAAMAINNWFGFRGVANFARYLAAPVLILWVCYAFGKTASHIPLSLLFESSRQPFSLCLVMIPVLVIGNTTWGNEADFFRYGKSSTVRMAIPLVVSVVFGAILFPTTGWLLGHASGAADTASFTKFMNDYSFGHAPWLATFALVVGYFAVNDGNLYGAINALENIWKTTRHKVVVALVCLAGILAIALSFCPSALDLIASLNSVVLPCITMIIIFEYFMAGKFTSGNRNLQIFMDSKLAPLSDRTASRNICWTAMIALTIGWIVGITTSGVLPQLKFLNVGVWILYAWFSSFAIYGIARVIQIRRANQAGRLLSAVEYAYESEALNIS